MGDREARTLLTMPSGLLASMWHEERVVVGMRVCRRLHRELPLLVERALLVVGSRHIMNRDEMVTDLCRFQNCRISVRGRRLGHQETDLFSHLWSQRGRKPTRLEQLLSAMNDAAEQGFGRALAHLDLSSNVLGTETMISLARLLGHCEQLGSLALSSLPRLLDVSELEGPFSFLRPSCSSLTCLNLSDCPKSEAASASSLADILQCCTLLRDLDLSACALVRSSSVLRALQHCTSLTRLNLRWTRFGEQGATDLAALLSYCTAMEELSVSGTELGDEGAKALAPSLGGCARLRRLHLDSNDIGEEGMRELGGWLQGVPRLRELRVGANWFNGAGAEGVGAAVRACRQMQVLDMGQCGLGLHVRWIAHGLSHSGKQITHLNLQENELGGAGWGAVCEVLGECSGLAHLDLSANDCSPSGATELAGVLAACTALAHLDLGENRLGAEGTAAVAAAAAALPALTHLNVARNAAGAQGFAAVAASCSRLRHLDMSSNSVVGAAWAVGEHLLGWGSRLECLRMRSNAAGERGARELARWMEACAGLRSVDLSRCEIAEEGAAAVAAALSRSGSVQRLRLTRNAIGDAGAVRVAAELARSCKELTELDLGHNQIGAEGLRALQEVARDCGALQKLVVFGNRLDEAYEELERLKTLCADYGIWGLLDQT